MKSFCHAYVDVKTQHKLIRLFSSLHNMNSGITLQKLCQAETYCWLISSYMEAQQAHRDLRRGKVGQMGPFGNTEVKKLWYNPSNKS